MRFVEGHAARMIGARLEHGEDLVIAIRELAEKTGVKSGAWFAIGTLSRACFYFYRPKPMPTVIEKPLEIVSCSGSIAWAVDKKAPVVHGHIDVTDEEYRSFGGHLLEGSIIDALGFIAIFELAGASLADLEK